MKKAFIILIFSFCFHALPAQNQGSGATPGIGLSFVWSDIGSNTALSYMHQFGRSTLIAGLKYQNNNRPDDIRQFALRKKAYAANASEAIGLNLEYTFDLAQGCQVTPYALVMMQVSNLRLRWASPADQFQIKTITTNRFIFLEHFLGGGIKIKMSERWYLNQSAAFGILFNKASEPFPSHVIYDDGPSWGLGGALRLGLICRLAG